MKIFKTIYRVDFDLSYSLIDRFGEYIEFIKNSSNNYKFMKKSEGVDLVGHSSVFKAESEDSIFSLNINLNNINALIEFKNGTENPSRDPLFKISDELFSKFEKDNGSKYNRIGVRNFIIIEENNLVFSDMRDKLWEKTKSYADCFDPIYQKEDIAIIYELTMNKGTQSRVSFGPYRKEERQKYFELNNDVETGIIFDIDFWDTQIKLPGLSIKEKSKNYTKYMFDIAAKIGDTLKKELKNEQNN